MFFSLKEHSFPRLKHVIIKGFDSNVYSVTLVKQTHDTYEAQGGFNNQGDHCQHNRSYSGLCFPAFELNTDQNNSEYGHFLRSAEDNLEFSGY